MTLFNVSGTTEVMVFWVYVGFTNNATKDKLSHFILWADGASQCSHMNTAVGTMAAECWRIWFFFFSK